MTRWGRAALLLGWVLVLIALGLVVFQRLQVSSDLRSFMPTPTTPDQRLLMDQVGSGAGSRLLLLAIDGAPAERLGELSKALLLSLQEDPRYSQVINGGFDMSQLDERLLPYRYLLSPGLDRQPLDAAYLGDQLRQRLDELSSPAAGLLKGLLARDPTLELLNLARRWTPMRAPRLRDGVWFSSRGEALLLVQTAAAGFDPQAQQAAIDGIQTRFHALPGADKAKLQISGRVFSVSSPMPRLGIRRIGSGAFPVSVSLPCSCSPTAVFPRWCFPPCRSSARPWRASPC